MPLLNARKKLQLTLILHKPGLTLEQTPAVILLCCGLRAECEKSEEKTGEE